MSVLGGDSDDAIGLERKTAEAATPHRLKVAGNLRPSPSSESRRTTPSLPAHSPLTGATSSRLSLSDLDTKDGKLPGQRPAGQTLCGLVPPFPFFPEVRRFLRGGERREVVAVRRGGNAAAWKEGGAAAPDALGYCFSERKSPGPLFPSAPRGARRREGPRLHL